MPEPLLSVKNLSISFQNEKVWHSAVKRVSFDLNKGETLGIVGESGSGKSVTSLAIMKLLPNNYSRIDEGEIIFQQAGETAVNLITQTEKELKHIRGKQISMIFQEPMTSLNPVMRCGKQIEESVMLHLKYNRKKAREYVTELLAEVRLPDPERAYRSFPHQLSGGQKQRVMIAMAIACHPQILIADEPTTALDVTVQKGILLLLKSLQNKYGLSLIFISHDLGVISEIADHVVVMNHGTVVEKGDVKSVMFHPVHPYTKGLIACRPPLDKRFQKLPVVSDFLDEPGKASEISIIKDPLQRITEHQILYAAKPLLEVKSLSVEYRQQPGFFMGKAKVFKAVNDVSFNVFKGETLGLVGESGCGKTTLGRAILKLTESASGDIIFDGLPVQKLSSGQIRKLRQRMQIMFQDPYSSLNPRITAGEAILEPIRVHGLQKDKSLMQQMVIQLLDQVGLEKSSYYRFPHQFSGGQRQRICIARALAVNPEFIVCDESVSALDVSVQAQVLNLLNELKNVYNLTYIFISHDLSVVRYMSDRIMVMKSGKIVESNEADSLYYNPQENYTRELIEAIPGRLITTAHS